MHAHILSTPRSKLSLPFGANRTGATTRRAPANGSPASAQLSPGDLRRIVSDMIG